MTTAMGNAHLVNKLACKTYFARRLNSNEPCYQALPWQLANSWTASMAVIQPFDQ